MGDWGKAAGGAASGAAAGAALGPWGAGAGALIGGALGYFSGGEEKNPYADVDKANFAVPGYQGMMQDYNAAVYGGQPGVSGQSGFRGRQVELANMLRAQAQGQGPGQQLAQMRAKQFADRAAAQQMAMAQGQRGGMGALAGRNAAMAAASAQSRAGEQAMQGSLAAQLGATQQLGGVLAGGRGQDISQSQFNASQRNAWQQEMMRQRMGLAGMQQQGMMGYEAARTGRYAPWQATEANQPSQMDKYLGAMGGFAQGASAWGAGSKGGAVARAVPGDTGPYGKGGNYFNQHQPGGGFQSDPNFKGGF